MERYAFKMFLNPGAQAQYRLRHDQIWPELGALLHEAGIRNYTIHLDTQTHVLFAQLERLPGHTMDKLQDHPVMRRWWEHMKDLMRTNPDGSPKAIPLLEMFHQD